MATGLRTLHERLGTWQRVADTLGFSRAYWWRVAHGRLAPSADVLGRWEAHNDSRWPYVSGPETAAMPEE